MVLVQTATVHSSGMYQAWLTANLRAPRHVLLCFYEAAIEGGFKECGVVAQKALVYTESLFGSPHFDVHDIIVQGPC